MHLLVSMVDIVRLISQRDDVYSFVKVSEAWMPKPSLHGCIYGVFKKAVNIVPN